MLAIDLTGKRALVAGVSDDGGFGFAIAKSLAEAGATICVGSWPPALGIFTKLLERGKMDESMRLSDGRKLGFERIYPLDAAFDALADAPTEIRENKRYKEVGDFSVGGMTERLPNVTSVDLSTVQETLERLIDRVVLAIRFMALFTLGAGALVLVGALATSRFQRIREGALLRTLGATRAQLLRIVLSEYLSLGLLAALVALLLAGVAGWALARFVFDGRFTLPVLPLAGLGAAVVALTVMVGLANSREVLRRPPLEVLRAE